MSTTLPIKQTVYFLKEEVNLEENYYLQDLNGEFYLEQKGYFFTPEQLNEYTEMIVKEALQKAAADAYTKFIAFTDDEEVDKQSILNTFEETFNKFKV